MKHLTTVLSLVAFALASVLPASATAPTFNGNSITPTTPAVNALWYGVKCNGSNDDTTAAQNAINAAAQLSASKTAVQVLFPGGTCQFSSTLNVNTSNVNLVGVGADQEQDAGTDCQYATIFKWTGTASNPIVQISAVSGANGQEVYNSGVQNVCFTSNTTNKASHALSVLSVTGSLFSHLHADSTFGGSKFYFGTVTQLQSHTDDTHNLLIDFACTGASSDAQDCLYLDGGGTPTGDFALNTIINFQADYYSGNGITCNFADNNVFINVNTYMTAGGSGQALDLKSQCDSNYFERLSIGPAASATWLAETGSNYNTVEGLDVGSNASPIPTIQSGATIAYTEDTGIRYKQGYVNGVYGSNRADVTSGRTNLDTASSLYVYNGSSDHIVLDDGTRKWHININGASGLRINETNGGTDPVTVNNNLTSLGTVTASAHNGCSATSGIPCETTFTCSISAGGTSCSGTVTVPTNSSCTVTQSGADTTTGAEWFKTTLSTNTLTIAANVASSQTSTAGGHVNCL